LKRDVLQAVIAVTFRVRCDVRFFLTVDARDQRNAELTDTAK